MLKRHISLFYGSISVKRGLHALWCWSAGLFETPDKSRVRLAQAVNEHFSDGAVFAFGSARSSLAACLKATGIGPGDEVLLSAYTCLAVPIGVIASGAKPIYMDINPDTLNVETADVIAALTPKTKAVVVQHTLGKPAPIQQIVAALKGRGIVVIEDCALALGSQINGLYTGTFGDAAIFSMELSKTLSSGWGGILLVNNPKLEQDVKMLYKSLPEAGALSSLRDLLQTVISAWCSQAVFSNLLGKYIMAAGFKSHVFRSSTPKAEFDGHISPRFMVKMGRAQLALAVLQWENLKLIAADCVSNANIIRATLHRLDIPTPGVPNANEIAVAPRVSFLVANRQFCQTFFSAKGIELGQWFNGPLSPVPRSRLFNYFPGKYPAAEKVAARVVNLPCHGRLSQADLAHVVASLETLAKKQSSNLYFD